MGCREDEPSFRRYVAIAPVRMRSCQLIHFALKGPEEEAEIASLAVHNNDIFASAGPKVVRYQRGKQVAVYQASAADVKLGQILIFGEQLLALRQDGRGLLVWKISTLGKSLSSAFGMECD